MVPLTQLEVVGLRPRLDDALTALQELRLAEVVTIVDPGETPPDLADLITRTDAVMALVDQSATGSALSDAALRTTLDRVEPQVAKLLAEEEELRGEAEALPRSIDALDALQPLVPELGRLNDRRLANLGLASMALVLDDPDVRIVPELTRQLAELLGRAHLMVTSAATPGSPIGCLLVLRRVDLSEVDALLGTEHIVEVGIPAAYAGKSLRATVEAMRERLAILSLLARTAFIFLGAALVNSYAFMFYIFGLILLVTAGQMLNPKTTKKRTASNVIVRLAKRFLRTSETYDGDRLFTIEQGRRVMTPMLLVMVAIGGTDVLFALDSIPAIFGLTQSVFIVFTATAFSLLGLRQLYFLIDGLLDRLIYLSYGLAAILAFIGVKLILHALHENNLPFVNNAQPFHVPEISTALSLSVIAGVLIITVVSSLISVRILAGRD